MCGPIINKIDAISNILLNFLIFFLFFICSSCLQSWLEQDTSCPTCRLGLSVQNAASIHPDIERIIDEQENTTRANNHFFHFNGKYLLYLETLSIKYVCSLQQKQKKKFIICFFFAKKRFALCFVAAKFLR